MEQNQDLPVILDLCTGGIISRILQFKTLVLFSNFLQTCCSYGVNLAEIEIRDCLFLELTKITCPRFQNPGKKIKKGTNPQTGRIN